MLCLSALAGAGKAAEGRRLSTPYDPLQGNPTIAPTSSLGPTHPEHLSIILCFIYTSSLEALPTMTEVATPPTALPHDLTSTNLVSVQAKSILSYLQTAFPEVDSTIATSSSTTDTCTIPEVELVQNTQSEGEVPFYIKSKGKGKGKPILYSPLRSSVAQCYERAAQLGIADPVFTQTSTGAA